MCVCIYFCRSIFADKSPALITHSMPTNRVKTIDEKIVNRFSKFTLHYCWGVRGNWIFADPAKICGHLLNEHMWTWYVCVCLSSLYSVTLHEINLVKFARPLNGIDMSWLLFIIQNLFFSDFPKTYCKTFLVEYENSLKSTNRIGFMSASQITIAQQIELNTSLWSLALQNFKILNSCQNKWMHELLYQNEWVATFLSLLRPLHSYYRPRRPCKRLQNSK